MQNDGSKVLVGIIVGTFAAIGIGVGAYVLCKTDTAKLLKRKYLDWKEDILNKDE